VRKNRISVTLANFEYSTTYYLQCNDVVPAKVLEPFILTKKTMSIFFVVFLVSVTSLLLDSQMQAQSLVIHTNSFSFIADINTYQREIEQRALTIIHTVVPISSHSDMITPLGRYRELLSIYPLPTQAVTGGILAFAGDAIAQRTDKGCYVYNSRRGVSFMAFDMAYRTLQHYIFPWVSLTFHGQYISTVLDSIGVAYQDQQLFAAIEGTFVNQLFIVPLFYYPVFFAFTALLQGQTILDGVQRAKSMFFPLMQRNLAYWLPVQFIQFRFIEENLQIPFVCIAGLCWTVILSASAGNSMSQTLQDRNKENMELISFSTDYVRDRKQ
jgi:Mpv17 / PMP22 family